MLGFLKRLFGGNKFDAEKMQRKFEEKRQAVEAANGTPAPEEEAPVRRRKVGVFTLRDEVASFLSKELRPLTAPDDCDYVESPPLDEALRCQVLVFDVAPEVDIKLHATYDQIVRIKKSQGKFGDLLCAIGPSKKYVEYPRGTYPGIQYFPLDDLDFYKKRDDLPPGGKQTLEGPNLRRLSELHELVAKKLEDLKYAG